MPTPSKVKLSLKPSEVRAFAMDAETSIETLSALGVNVPATLVKQIQVAYAQDASPDLLTGASTSTPIQFLQHFLPDVIRTVTQKRTIDQILGRDIAGTFSDEEIVATIIEPVGQAKPYGDKTNDSMIDWNPNFEKRTITRWGLGMEVGVLEEMRSSAMRINSASEKRTAIANAFAIEQNSIGFNGFNSGANRTYGLLNDPNLPNYVTVSTKTAGGTTWAVATFLEITNDIKAAMSALRTRSGSNFDPYADASTLVVASAAIDNLATVNALGTTSVKQWLAATYPNCRVENAPQFSGANGGANAFYVISDSIGGRKVINQYVPDVFRLLGVQQKSKSFEESYACATAGVLLAQPLGVVRRSGI